MKSQLEIMNYYIEKNFFLVKCLVPVIALHWMYELPVIPGGQLQVITWLYTLQSAVGAHAPTHGSTHF